MAIYRFELMTLSGQPAEPATEIEYASHAEALAQAWRMLGRCDGEMIEVFTGGALLIRLGGRPFLDPVRQRFIA